MRSSFIRLVKLASEDFGPCEDDCNVNKNKCRIEVYSDQKDWYD